MLLHTMVRFNDFIHKILESIVRVMAASIDSDTGISVLTAREDSCLEREAMLVLGSLVFRPNFWGEVLHQKGFCSSWEFWEAYDIFWLFEMGSALGLFDFFLNLLNWSSSLFRTSKLFFLFNHGLDTIIHILNKLSLTSSKPSLV